MKKCPFCAEDIKNEAIKCKHCGEFLNKKKNEELVSKNEIIGIDIRSWDMHIDFAKKLRKINKLFEQRDTLDVFFTQNKIIFTYGNNPDIKEIDNSNLPFVPFLIIAGINKYRARKLDDISSSDINSLIENGSAIYSNIEDTKCVIENIKGSMLSCDYGFFGREVFFCRVTFSGKFYYLNNEFTGTIAGTYDDKPKNVNKLFKNAYPNLTILLPKEKLDNQFQNAINEKVKKMDCDEILEYYQDKDYFNHKGRE